MIAAISDFDPNKLLNTETLSRETVLHLKKETYSAKENLDVLREKIKTLETSVEKEQDGNKIKDLKLSLGMCKWIVGDVEEAIVLLKEVKTRKIGTYFLGKCYQEQNKYTQALECFERAQKTDTEEFDIQMDIADVKRMEGDISKALKIVKHFSTSHDDNAELHYQWGFILEASGEYEEAFTHYEKALQIDPHHAKTLFRMAFNYDIGGDDEKAIEYYTKCTELCPTYKNAFINLGVLCEDKGDYDSAVFYYEAVHDVDPTNERVSLFLKYANASLDMYYDEAVSKKQGKDSEVLNIPISDFELSVRSRNCLEKMNIRTLKDLTRIAEPDLLTFKNFGETSLNEIKSILNQKGLRLGQAFDDDDDNNNVDNLFNDITDASD